MKCGQQQKESTLDTFFGKTFQGRSVVTRERTLERSCRYFGDKKFQCLEVEDGRPQVWLSDKVPLLGEYSMLNTSESPNDAVESFLSEILVVDAPEKYSLSAKCAKGIIRRAAQKERPLPYELAKALEEIAWTPEDQAEWDKASKKLES